MQMNCMNCDHQLICRNADDDKNHVCSMYDPIFHKTNADRIRKMSDEELSELLYEAQMSVLNEMCPNKYIVEDTWLEWLQQEVE